MASRGRTRLLSLLDVDLADRQVHFAHAEAAKFFDESANHRFLYNASM